MTMASNEKTEHKANPKAPPEAKKPGETSSQPAKQGDKDNRQSKPSATGKK